MGGSPGIRAPSSVFCRGFPQKLGKTHENSHSLILGVLADSFYEPFTLWARSGLLSSRNVVYMYYWNCVFCIIAIQVHIKSKSLSNTAIVSKKLGREVEWGYRRRYGLKRPTVGQWRKNVLTLCKFFDLYVKTRNVMPFFIIINKKMSSSYFRQIFLRINLKLEILTIQESQYLKCLGGCSYSQLNPVKSKHK